MVAPPSRIVLATVFFTIAIAIAVAACSPAAAPVQGKVRHGSTVRTSCPDRAPAFDDDPNHMVLVDERIIERVCVLGTSSEESRAAIARASGLHEGDKLDRAHVRAALDALVALKTVEDASIGAELRGEGVVVFVDVRERARIDEVVFEGARSLGELDEKGLLEKGGPLDRRAITAVVRVMEREYLARGYGSVKIEPAIEPLGPGHVRVRFVVAEGPPWWVSKLVFNGASKVSEVDLRKATTLTDGAAYDRDQVARASLLINTLYYERGMLQVKIAEPKNDVAIDGAVTITWAIEEGETFRIGTVRFSKLAEKMQKELSKEMKTRPNDVFDRSKVTADIVRLKALFERGGRKVEVTPVIDPDTKKKRVDLNFMVEEAK